LNFIQDFGHTLTVSSVGVILEAQSMIFAIKRILGVSAKKMLTETIVINVNLMHIIWKKTMHWVVQNVSVLVQLIAVQVLHFEPFKY
jgi:ribosomal protein L31E